MPDREVKQGLMTYIAEDGVSRYGLQGETVTVHPDHVKRFDELNVDMGEPFEPQRVPEQMVAPGGGEDPHPQPKKAPAKKAT